MSKFLAIFIENEKKGVHDENICNIMGQAYEQTLKAHHGWATRFLFGVTYFIHLSVSDSSQCIPSLTFSDVARKMSIQNSVFNYHRTERNRRQKIADFVTR